jgi:hypothetical protein
MIQDVLRARCCRRRFGLGNGYRTLLSRSLAPAATVDVRAAWSLHCTIRTLVLIGSSPLGAKECGLTPDSLPPAGFGCSTRRTSFGVSSAPMPSRAGGDFGGRSLFFTHGEGLEPQSGSASKSPQALAAYLRRSASRGGGCCLEIALLMPVPEPSGSLRRSSSWLSIYHNIKYICKICCILTCK